MKVKESFENYLKENQKKKTISILHNNSWVLMGYKQLYQATEEEDYRNIILNSAEEVLKNSKSYENYELENYNIDNINNGKILFFVYELTKDEKYRQAIEGLMNQLRQHRGTDEGFFCKEGQNSTVCPQTMYKVLPFYMEYETKFDNKAKYNDIVKQFQNMRQGNQSAEDFDLDSTAWYFISLIDGMEAMSQEIFEHYKTLEGLFKEGFARFYESIYKDNGKLSVLQKFMFGYAISKACRMGVLNKEKYAEVGTSIIDEAFSSDACEKNVENNSLIISLSMMAYAQELMLKATL